MEDGSSKVAETQVKNALMKFKADLRLTEQLKEVRNVSVESNAQLT